MVRSIKYPIMKMSIEIHSEILPYMRWHEAVQECSRLGDGWRLPTIEELNGIFNNTKPGDFGCWSATVWEHDDSMVWSKGFNSGNAYLNPKTNLNRVLAVKNQTADKDYWSSDLPFPLAPTEEDVQTYQNNLLPGTVLLLGCTKRLIPLSDRQLDLDPWHRSDTVIVGDWTGNRHFYTNIILDGGLCFTKALCDRIIEMASRNCQRFITRSFSHRLDIMRVADYFPGVNDLPIKPARQIRYPEYNFFIWDF